MTMRSSPLPLPRCVLLLLLLPMPLPLLSLLSGTAVRVLAASRLASAEPVVLSLFMFMALLLQ